MQADSTKSTSKLNESDQTVIHGSEWFSKGPFALIKFNVTGSLDTRLLITKLESAGIVEEASIQPKESVQQPGGFSPLLFARVAQNSATTFRIVASGDQSFTLLLRTPSIESVNRLRYVFQVLAAKLCHGHSQKLHFLSNLPKVASLPLDNSFNLVHLLGKGDYVHCQHKDSCRTRAEFSFPLSLATTSQKNNHSDGNLEVFLRTAFAILLSFNTGTQNIAVSSLNSGEILSLTIIQDEFFCDLLTRWLQIPSHTDSSLNSSHTQIQHFLDVLESPAFFFTKTQRIREKDFQADVEYVEVSNELYPVICSTWVHEQSVYVQMAADAKLLNTAEIQRLGMQYKEIIRSLHTNLSVPVENVLQRIPPLRFSIKIATAFGSEPLRLVIEDWIRRISLPAKVRTLPSGKTTSPSILAERRLTEQWGATVLLERLDDWMPKQYFIPVSSGNLSNKLKQFLLPNKLLIAELNRGETNQLYDEIFVRRSYLRHGITLPEQACVFDLGANIGLFTLFVSIECRSAIIHSIEPVPEIVEVLLANTQFYNLSATVHGVAIGSKTDEVNLVYYPSSTLQSGLYTNPDRDEFVVRQYAYSQLLEKVGNHNFTSRDFDALIEERFQEKHYRVPLKTLSEIIEKENVKKIDLLKIDVERSELEVLEGIKEAHWQIIQQIVLEVHDSQTSKKVIEILENRGFNIAIDKDVLFSGTAISTVYARSKSLLNVVETEKVIGTEIRNEIDKHISQLLTAVDAAARNAKSNNVYVALCPSYQATITPLWKTVENEIEARLHHSINKIEGAQWLPLSNIAEQYSVKSIYRTPQSVNSNSLYSLEYLAALATTISRRVTSSMRVPVKAIVVDADNTLWGGVCGEVGAKHITLDKHHINLQLFLLNQRLHGRLICLCSKNNISDIEEAFAYHQDMPIKLSDFSGFRVNWNLKSDNIIEMVNDLGISVESVVVIDDDPRERDEIKTRLPEAIVINMPNEAHLFPTSLQATWALDIEATTTEDQLRADFQSLNNKRDHLMAASRSFTDFLEHLCLNITVSSSSNDDAERIAQLSQRTNQFTLTFSRLTVGEVRDLIAHTNVNLSVRVKDKFGDYGLVGFASGSLDKEEMKLTHFFISCRALGKNVEWEVLRTLAVRAQEHGASTLRLYAIPDSRNIPAQSFVHDATLLFDQTFKSDGVSISCRDLIALDWRTMEPALIQISKSESYDNRNSPSHHSTCSSISWPSPGETNITKLIERVIGLSDFSTHLKKSSIPHTSIERRVAKIWQEVLSISSVGIHEDFLSIGGDSLSAMRIAIRISEYFQISVSVDELLRASTIASLAYRIEVTTNSRAYVSKDIELKSDTATIDEEDIFLTRGQERIWAAETIQQKHRNDQIIPCAYLIEGEVDRERLENAFLQLIQRHEALRSLFVLESGERLVIRPCTQAFSLDYHDIDEFKTKESSDTQIERMAESFFSRRFDLSADLMIRASLKRLSVGRFILLIAIHHFACDGWSLGLIQRDLSAFYNDPTQNNAVIGLSRAGRFSDYAKWVHELEATPAYKGSLNYWLCQMKSSTKRGSEKTDYFADSRRHRKSCFQRFNMPVKIVSNIYRFASEELTTPATVFLMAAQILMAVWNNQGDGVIAWPVANRNTVEQEETVGFLANIVLMKLDMEWTSSYRDHLSKVHRSVLDAQRHLSASYTVVSRNLSSVENSSGTRLPFDMIVTWQNTLLHALNFNRTNVRRIDSGWWPTPFDLMLDIEKRNHQISLLYRYNSSLFSLRDIQDLFDIYLLILRILPIFPDASLSTLRHLVGVRSSLNHENVDLKRSC